MKQPEDIYTMDLLDGIEEINQEDQKSAVESIPVKPINLSKGENHESEESSKVRCSCCCNCTK
jgi:ABC-type dipeptide/oligopeptide/nickel transport system ATPase component